VPDLGYDWLNYGGITRDVYLVSTNVDYISDYFIQIRKGSENEVEGWVKIEGEKKSQEIKVSIPELNKKFISRTDEKWFCQHKFHCGFYTLVSSKS
jgi:beta-glucuronidase